MDEVKNLVMKRKMKTKIFTLKDFMNKFAEEQKKRGKILNEREKGYNSRFALLNR